MLHNATTSMCRASGFSIKAQVEQLYDNMSPDYKHYICLDDVTSLEDLCGRIRGD